MSTQYFGNNTVKLNGESVARDLTGIAAMWANLNGTGTIALRDSLNVSSVTDRGTGLYTLNTTSAFASTNSMVGGVAASANAAITDLNRVATFVPSTTSAGALNTNIGDSAAAVDVALASAVVMGDLA